MSNEPNITIVGNLTTDPELRFTESGVAVANFTVAQTPRLFDRQSNEWKDGETLFMRCSVWREQAEHVAASLRKGNEVIVEGALKSRSYERDGQKRTVFEMTVETVGVSLKKATVQGIAKKSNGDQNGNGQNGGFQGQGNAQAAQAAPVAQQNGFASQQPAQYAQPVGGSDF